MKTKYLFTAIAVVILTCCKKSSDIESKYNLKTPDSISVIDYQIYSVVLTELFQNSKNPVVMQTTSNWISITIGDGYYQYLKEKCPDLDSSIVKDLHAKNDTTYNLWNLFQVENKTITLLTSDELNSIFDGPNINQGWDEFYKKYPESGGYISFSRIGFNTERTQAILEIGNTYASLGGEGSCVLLKKENNSWKILETVFTWISK